MFNNHKAQVGETMTWVVATIIIIAVLIISIYAASLLAQTKKTIPYQKEKREGDLLMEKSLFVYFSVDDTKKNIIYNKLEQQEFAVDLNDKRDEIKEVLG